MSESRYLSQIIMIHTTFITPTSPFSAVNNTLHFNTCYSKVFLLACRHWCREEHKNTKLLFFITKRTFSKIFRVLLYTIFMKKKSGVGYYLNCVFSTERERPWQLVLELTESLLLLKTQILKSFTQIHKLATDLQVISESLHVPLYFLSGLSGICMRNVWVTKRTIPMLCWANLKAKKRLRRALNITRGQSYRHLKKKDFSGPNPDFFKFFSPLATLVVTLSSTLISILVHEFR